MSRTSMCKYLSLLLLVVQGCNTPAGPIDQEQIPESQDVPILWEKAGAQCSLQVPVRLVARSAAVLAQTPLADVPVDFSSQMVLIAGLGTVATDGYVIRITRVWRQGNRIHAGVQVTAPKPARQPRPFNPHSPYHIVVVPRSDLNVEDFSTSLPKDPRGHNPYK